MMEQLVQYNLKDFSVNDLPQLKNDWQTLELKSKAPFFLCWTWISCWLETMKPECSIVRGYDKETLISIAIMVSSRFSSLKRFQSKQLHFHQTGHVVQDQIWIEYNGLLVCDGYEEAAYHHLMPFLINNFPGWDEMRLGAVSKKIAATLQETSGLNRLDLWQAPSFGVNLDRVRVLFPDYLSSLSRNTRYQIRRSLKQYKQQGGVELKFASSSEEAIEFFNQCAPIHILKWGEGPGESGFTNSLFVNFHRRLINQGFPLKQIDMIKVICDGRVLGYLYNFLYRKRVYFYLSGLVAEDDPKLKPGLCAHALVIQHYLDNGYHFYDFMGGNDRYKSSLGDVHDELYLIALQKDRIKFKIESVLRRLKQSFMS